MNSIYLHDVGIFNPGPYIDYHEIETSLRLDYLSEEEREKLIKMCNKYYTIFQKPTEPLSNTTLISYQILMVADGPSILNSTDFGDP